MKFSFSFCLLSQAQPILSLIHISMRLGETSTLLRNEDSGEMHGLIRVRQFTISQGHLVLRPDQLEEEFQQEKKNRIKALPVDFFPCSPRTKALESSSKAKGLSLIHI